MQLVSFVRLPWVMLTISAGLVLGCSRGEQAVVVFRFDDVDRAVARLREAGATLLEAADVQEL